MNKIYIEGHRGACALYPENTLLSFGKAMKMGVDAVEFDVRLTADKVPVLMHDGISGFKLHTRPRGHYSYSGNSCP